MANHIIVCQTGARHRYLIPEVLENAGMLSRLYTDSTCYSPVGRLSTLLASVGLKSKNITHLSKRVPNVPANKIFSTDRLFLRKTLANIKSKADSLEKRYIHYTGFADVCKRWGVGDADCVYNMFIENFDFMVYAKSKGLKIVVDIYEVPMTYKLLIDEIKSNSEYSIFEKQVEAFSYSHAVRMHYMEDVLKLADYYTVPSKFVIKSLNEFKNFNPAKVLFLPYGSSIVPKSYYYRPQKHRLIWVGNDPIRKGLLYCAKAVDILKHKYPDIDFRVAGVTNNELSHSPVFSNLSFIGVLSKEQLMEEFCSAEAYVFPTMLEGFAGTVIEAASCGCPIITTECAGTDICSFPALYIPPRNVTAIVEAIERIFENPSERDDLSRRVFDYAKSLSPDNYAKNLVAYLKKV